MSKVVGIDLFCGIGGLTNGLVKSGIKIKAGYDIDPNCEVSFSQRNNGNPEFVPGDIKIFGEDEFKRHFLDLLPGDYKLVAGCAPCQPYSSHQKKKSTFNRSQHKSYGLIKEYLRVVEIIDPEFVIMENVRELSKDPIFKTDFLNYFKKNNYFINYEIVDMANYGAPQRRKRLLFLAVKKTVKNFQLFQIQQKISLKRKTVFDTIGNLSPIENGSVDPNDFMHQSSKLTEINLQRIKASNEGGSWKDWPKSLLPNCYKKETGKTYTSVYGRMSRNDVAPTLTTQFNRYGTGRYGHYEQNRAISLREGALLQTFPKDYKFNKHLGATTLARQIGNAVPPIYAEILGKLITKNI